MLTQRSVVGATIFTAVTTLGLALLLFGRSRAREFIALEIEEGVRKTTAKAEPKRWLHWLSLPLRHACRY